MNFHMSLKKIIDLKNSQNFCCLAFVGCNFKIFKQLCQQGENCKANFVGAVFCRHANPTDSKMSFNTAERNPILFYGIFINFCFS